MDQACAATGDLQGQRCWRTELGSDTPSRYLDNSKSSQQTCKLLLVTAELQHITTQWLAKVKTQTMKRAVCCSKTAEHKRSKLLDEQNFT
jgi:hypothetical protein